MPTREVRIYAPKGNGQDYTKFWLVRNWIQSERVGRKLMLQGWPLQSMQVDYYHRFTKPGWWNALPDTPDGAASFLYPSEYGMSQLESESYARFRGKLYKGSASLGVTLGSYKQSREMIVGRYGQLSQKADYVLGDLGKARTKRQAAKLVANTHLEVVFGWVPLLQDIHAAATSVIQLAPTRRWVTARSVSESLFDKGGGRLVHANARVTRSAMVTVSNPNLWLLERAGLLNPAAVAWDLVPWSFVVNMFVNTGQLVNSITDFAGLTFDNSTITRFRAYTCYHVVAIDGFGVVARGTYGSRDKRRAYGADQVPNLLFKLPDANWELAAIAASLFTQKLSSINRLLNLLRK